MEKNTQVTVVMVPIPCQSHLNQLLGLGSLLSSRGLPVHFLGSATHNRQARVRAAASSVSEIHFHDLPTPPIDSPDPSTDLDKLPVHMAPAMSAYHELRLPIGAFVREMSKATKKVVLIYDRLIAEGVGDAVSVPNVESYAFNCISAFNLFYILWETLGKPFAFQGEPDFQNNPFSVTDFYPDPVLRFIASKPEHFKARAGDLHNTIRLIDGKYIDLLAREEIGGKRQQWAISPLLSASHGTRTRRHECLDWLDNQAPRSVVYVSFGTSVSLSGDEIREIASGLERSEQRFVWALRDADRADIFSREDREIELPEGFEERNRDKGIVLRGWAPQREILAHKSTGGFMSHCGWNSCFESLAGGVPILAWPMHSDQPLNAIFVTEVLRIGLVVREWAERGEVVKALVIENAVRRIMASEEGDEVRKRAAEMSDAVAKAGEEGGECWRELEGFIAHIISR